MDSVSAILYLLGETRNRIEKVILTASGGPFLGKKPNFLVNVKRDHALQHPNWAMGAKISIDSATLMNKGLEMIEARWLFNLQPGQIQVVIHSQSIIHSMVQFEDGSIKAQMGLRHEITNPVRSGFHSGFKPLPRYAFINRTNYHLKNQTSRPSGICTRQRRPAKGECRMCAECRQ